MGIDESLGFRAYWIAVKERNLGYYISESISAYIYIYAHYGDSIQVPGQKPNVCGPYEAHLFRVMSSGKYP